MKAIFDLDSTLFDVSPRIAKILHAFSGLPEIQKKYPKESELLSKVEPHEKDYGALRTLLRYGFTPPNPDFGKTLVSFWKQNFFANSYLQYDRPYPGSREFVHDLYEAGADIIYLTGRDVPRMLQGTLESLKHWGFPLDKDHANLALKPDTSISDSTFKKEFFEKMEKNPGPVWFFENEPNNINLVVSHAPHIHVIFVDTVHSGKHPEPPSSILRISGYVEP